MSLSLPRQETARHTTVIVGRVKPPETLEDEIEGPNRRRVKRLSDRATRAGWAFNSLPIPPPSSQTPVNRSANRLSSRAGPSGRPRTNRLHGAIGPRRAIGPHRGGEFIANLWQPNQSTIICKYLCVCRLVLSIKYIKNKKS